MEGISLVYFSATGTTKKIVTEIAAGIGLPVIQSIDLTKNKERERFEIECIGSLVLLGTPVHEERIPEVIRDVLPKLKGHGQPMVLVEVYGNIHVGAVLNDLDKTVKANGFQVIGAGIFIGEHSFTSKTVSIAKGRPDENDLAIANRFGNEIAKKLACQQPATITLPAFKRTMMSKILPDGSARFFAKPPVFFADKCNMCLACAKKCPVGAIDEETIQVNADLCIRCFVCVRICKQDSREIRYANDKLVKRFLEKQGGGRKEPTLFL